MIKIGQINRLTVVKKTDFGLFLHGDVNDNNILLPKRYAPKEAKAGDALDVFIYFDSEDQIIATTEKPLAQVWEFAKLTCVETNKFGAFLNWGLSKDLLVPFSEQRVKMQASKEYLVFIYLDKVSGRIVATTKYNKWMDKTPAKYRKGEQVSLTVIEKTDLGYKCAVNNEHWGVLFKSEMLGKLFIGKKLTGYIKQIRSDGKIDLSLQRLGMERVEYLAKSILFEIEKNGGFLPMGDKSSPEEIFALFKTSKASFKKAIGTLYKNKQIRIGSEGLYLIRS